MVTEEATCTSFKTRFLHRGRLIWRPFYRTSRDSCQIIESEKSNSSLYSCFFLVLKEFLWCHQCKRAFAIASPYTKMHFSLRKFNTLCLHLTFRKRCTTFETTTQSPIYRLPFTYSPTCYSSAFKIFSGRVTILFRQINVRLHIR